MPHYRCTPCRTRRRLSEASPGEVGHLCPDCGSLLDPVVELSQLVGFRAVGGTAASPTATTGQTAVIVRIEELLVRRALVREHDRQRALLSDEIGGGPDIPAAAAAVALPHPAI